MTSAAMVAAFYGKSFSFITLISLSLTGMVLADHYQDLAAQGYRWVIVNGLAMFGLGPATKVYLALGAADMRKGFDGLYGLVRERLLCVSTIENSPSLPLPSI